MPDNFDLQSWNNIKTSLKMKYPILTDSDLLWRDGGTKNDLLKELSTRIGITWKELDAIVNKL